MIFLSLLLFLDHVRCVTGRWSVGSNAGGQVSHNTFHTNPQIKFQIPSKHQRVISTLTLMNTSRKTMHYKSINSLFFCRRPTHEAPVTGGVWGAGLSHRLQTVQGTGGNVWTALWFSCNFYPKAVTICMNSIAICIFLFFEKYMQWFNLCNIWRKSDWLIIMKCRE